MSSPRNIALLLAIALLRELQVVAQGYAGADRRGVALGDGPPNVAGTWIRLRVRTNAGAVSRCPDTGAPTLSVLRAGVPGAARIHRYWHCHAATFCQAARFNHSNGVLATRRP